MEHAEVMTAFRHVLRICSRSMLMPAASCRFVCLGGVAPDCGQRRRRPLKPSPPRRHPSMSIFSISAGNMSSRRRCRWSTRSSPIEGIQGARIALQENAQTGRFVNQNYHLSEMILPLDADFKAKARAALATHKLIIADLEKDDLLALADMPEAKDAIIFDIRTSDDSLRQEQCRANVFHFLPNTAMRTDALAQYLVWKHWPNWLLVSGKHPADIAYADDCEAIGAQVWRQGRR